MAKQLPLAADTGKCEKTQQDRLSRRERNSSIEVLRIIAMLFIVLSHACGHGGLDKASAPLTLNKFFLQWGSLGSMSVNIFVLISGYFMCEKKFKLVSVSRLLAQTWFYSIALFLVCRFGFGYSYSLSQLLVVFLPTIFYEYWFLSAYIVLLLLSPFINHLLAALSRKQHLQLITTTLFLWVVIRTFTTSEMMGGAITHVVTIYIIGAYFRKYPQNWFSVKRHRIMLTVGSFALLFLSSVAVSLVAIKVPALAGKVNFFYARNSLLAVSCAVGLLTIFLHCKPFYSNKINTIAGCTFGVYLIHENPVVRTLLWKKLLYVAPYIDSLTLIPRILLNVVIVFSVCALIEFLRQKTVDAPLTKCVNAVLSRSMNFAQKCAKRILNY